MQMTSSSSFLSRLKTITLIASLLRFTSTAGAGPDMAVPDHFPADAIQLKRDYEAAIENATEPIRARYIADLKQLLTEEISQGNEPQADAIKTELDGLPGGSGISGDTIAEFESKLIDYTWSWNDVHTVIFTWGGLTRDMDLKWKSIAPYTIEYTAATGESGTITFDRSMQSATISEITPGGVKRTMPMERTDH